MAELEFFDANCALGRPMNGCLECAADAPALLAELDRIGVARALVRQINSGCAGAVCGNRILTEQLKADRSGRLVPCWSILPEDCDELPTGDELIAACRANGVKAVEIMPSTHRWVPRRCAVGALFDRLARHRVPIFVRVSEAGGWNGLYELVERFPENIFIAAHSELWGCDRKIRPLLLHFPNFYLETSEYWVAAGLAALVAKCGARQLLFGSGYPQWNHGQQMLQIRHAEIAEEDKIAIAGGNLKRLIHEVEL